MNFDDLFFQKNSRPFVCYANNNKIIFQILKDDSQFYMWILKTTKKERCWNQ